MKRHIISAFSLVFLFTILLSFRTSAQNRPPAAARLRVLAFYSTKVEAEHVDFAKELRTYLSALGVEKGFTFDATTDWTNMNEKLLKNYQVVIWVNDYPHTDLQRAAFQKYMDGGGAWLGFHTSILLDKTIKWPWFTSFTGGAVYSNKVSPALTARMLVDDTSSPIAKRIPPAYTAPADEWLQYKPGLRENKDIKVLVTMDPYMYPVGMKSIITSGDVPVVWTNTKYNMIYMGIGHNGQAVSDHLQNFMIADALLMLGKKK